MIRNTEPELLPIPTASTWAAIIRSLDLRVDQLLQARHLLAEILPAPTVSPVQPARRGRPVTQFLPGPKLLELMRTPAAQAQIQAALADSAPAAPRRTRKITPAGRKKMQQAQARRWKKFHQQRAQAQAAEKKLARAQKTA